MWLLIGIVFVVVLCTARGIVRGQKRRLPECVVPLPPSRFHSIDAIFPGAMPKRQVKWISAKECASLVHTSDNVVFIAIRSGSRNKRPSFPGLQSLSIAPNQLADVLRWLPPESCIVLSGEVDLCASALGSLDDIASSGPVYVLSDGPVHSEVA
jgi:hypothetical protein